MADGPISTCKKKPSSQQQKSKKKKKTTSDNSNDHDVVLAESVDVLDRKLKQLDLMAEPENQAIINDALRLQRDLLQTKIAVPAQPEVVVRSMRESPHFRLYATESGESDHDAQEAQNGGRRATRASILALLENVANSASNFAQQIHDSSLAGSTSKSTVSKTTSIEPVERKKRRAERKQRIDSLLERISKTPVNLMFGVRIRRKYAVEVSKRFGFDCQPYYTQVPESSAPPQTDTADCTSSSANSSDSETTPPPVVPRTNPPSSRKKEEPHQSADPYSSDDDSSSSSTLPSLRTKVGYSASRINGVKSQNDSQNSTRQRNAAGSQSRTTVDLNVDAEELDVLSWMERLKLEQSAKSSTVPFNAADAAANMLQNFMFDVAARESMHLPPEAMNVLHEAMMAVERERESNGGESSQIDDADKRAARATATTFIQSAVSSKNAGSSIAGSSSSVSPLSEGIPGLSPHTANEVWHEIQTYLQNLYASERSNQLQTKNGTQPTPPPPVNSSIAATLFAASQDTPVLPPESAPMDSASGTATNQRPVKQTAMSRSAKKKQKKKNKSTGTVDISEVLERRREILRLQAQKQKEHDEAVAELKAHEARLLELEKRRTRNPKMPYEIRTIESDCEIVKKKPKTEASASNETKTIQNSLPVPASWFEIKPPARRFWQIGSGPFGPTYFLADLAVTVHHDWIDDAMTARGLRAYWIIWFTERLRLYDRCAIRQYEARKVLDVHCARNHRGFLAFLTDGKTATEWTLENQNQLEEDEHTLRHQVFKQPCIHKYEWNVTFERMKAYHRRFYAMDSLLPPLPGDFMFLVDGIHKAIQEAQQKHETIEDYPRGSQAHKSECPCGRCVSERKLEEEIRDPPTLNVPPFSAVHRVDLILPTNFIIRQSVDEQSRLLKNQALFGRRLGGHSKDSDRRRRGRVRALETTIVHSATREFHRFDEQLAGQSGNRKSNGNAKR
ncbi:hypothetical protein M3Y98_01021300 [Aphelenchoides besseyi]|nr:hypothetical protein M3Y98_01021300 [Aphelenchoides besseyi]